MNLAESGNLIEAVLWFAVAAVLGLKATRANGPLRRPLVLLTLSFAVFGVTDLIEIRTGAWWKPPWLLLLKAACALGFLVGFVAYYRLARRPDPPTNH